MNDVHAPTLDIPQVVIISGDQSNSPEDLTPVHFVEEDAVAGADPDDFHDELEEDLGDRLSNKTLKSFIGLDGKTGYLPDVYYEAWLSREAIERVMGTDRPEVIDFISKKAKKAFTAVLITIGDSEVRREIVTSFYAHEFSDQHLPVTASDTKSLTGCLGYLNWSCGVLCKDIERGNCSTKHGSWLDTFHHKHWNSVVLNLFATNQWKLLVQDFNQHTDLSEMQFRFELEDERILPFKNVKYANSPSGHFSRVNEAQMLAAYQGVIEQNSGTIPVALKQLVHIAVQGYDIHEAWKRECDAYHLMNQRQHDNIVRGICGFQQQERHYLVLEWANGDNLRELWKELPGPHLDSSSDSSLRRSRGLVKKIFQQLRGLVDAIRIMHNQGGVGPSDASSSTPNAVYLAVREGQGRSTATRLDPPGGSLLPRTPLPPLSKSPMEHVHASSTSPPADSNGLRRQSSLASNPSQTEHTTEDVFNWRHGDIKPDNILRFLSSRPNQQTAQFSRIGTWKLADLGRAKANYDATMNRQNESENEMFATMYYEPPDLHLKHADGKPRHISRLFDIWSIGCVAWETVLWLVYGLSSVNKFVKDSVEGNTIRGFSKSTPYWAKRSHENHRAQRSPVLEHWFDLFLGFEEEQSSAIRDLVEVLKKKVFIVELHKNSLKYYTGYRTNAEDLLLELNKIIRRGEDDSDPYWYRGFDYCSAERLERSRVRPTAVLEASHNNGLWKSDSRLDAPAISPGQATAIAMGDEYTHPFNNTWIHELDDDDQDDCAIKHLYAFPPSYEKLKSRHVCEHCKGFTTLGEELKISREVLDVNVYESDLVCGLCQMIEEALETSLQGELTFMRSVAGIQLKGRERPVVRICQTPADTSGSTFRKGYRKGLPSLPDHGRADYFSILKGIVDHCESTHACRHGGSHGSASELPTRLLYLQDSAPRIVETKELSEQEKQHIEYTALSHRWGGDEFLHSTRANIKDRKRRIKLLDLPRTFKDAIEVTKILGLQYLWIDSLCILQGTHGDFDAEAERMQITFGQAYCVLAACDAKKAEGGFLRVQGIRSAHKECRLADSNLWASTVIDDFERDVLLSPLNKRGWVLQERALARRTLFFTKDQTYFECGRGIRSESMGRMGNSLVAFLGDSNFPKYAVSHNSSKGGQSDLLAYTFELYSRLDFTFAYDRPVAIDGLVQRMSISYRDQNVAGMFGRFWGRCLLWERAKDQKQLEHIRFKEAPPGRVPKEPPSWSWMAYHGAIKFLKIEGDSLEWNEAVKRPLKRVPFNDATQTSWIGKRRRDESVALLAPAFRLDSTCPASTEAYLRYDEGDAPHRLATRCVVIGTTKTPLPGETKMHYVLLVRQLEGGVECDYERIGVGVVPAPCVSYVSKEVSIS